MLAAAAAAARPLVAAARPLAAARPRGLRVEAGCPSWSAQHCASLTLTTTTSSSPPPPPACHLLLLLLLLTEVDGRGDGGCGLERITGAARMRKSTGGSDARGRLSSVSTFGRSSASTGTGVAGAGTCSRTRRGVLGLRAERALLRSAAAAGGPAVQAAAAGPTCMYRRCNKAQGRAPQRSRGATGRTTPTMGGGISRSPRARPLHGRFLLFVVCF